MSELRDITRIDQGEALQRQTAELIREEQRLDEALERFFRKYEELKARHLEARSGWERRFNPPMAGAYAGWSAHGSRDHRVELAQIAEAPIDTGGVSGSRPAEPRP